MIDGMKWEGTILQQRQQITHHSRKIVTMHVQFYNGEQEPKKTNKRGIVILPLLLLFYGRFWHSPISTIISEYNYDDDNNVSKPHNLLFFIILIVYNWNYIHTMGGCIFCQLCS